MGGAEMDEIAQRVMTVLNNYDGLVEELVLATQPKRKTVDVEVVESTSSTSNSSNVDEIIAQRVIAVLDNYDRTSGGPRSASSS